MRKRGSGTGKGGEKRGGKGETNKYQQNMETGEIARWTDVDRNGDRKTELEEEETEARERQKGRETKTCRDRDRNREKIRNR